MFRFLLILSLIVYVIYKVGSLFFRAGAASQQLRNQQRKNFEGNMDTDPSANRPNKKGTKGGEYIDYEEVK
jgi:hypothetical protein